MADLLEKIEREIAELNVLLGEVDTTHKKERTLPVDKGIKLLQVLDTELRPFIVKYTALLNRSKQFIPIAPNKLERFIPLAEELENCVEFDLAFYGSVCLWAIDVMVNGFNSKQEHITDIDELITFLYYCIKLTEDANGTIRLHTYVKGNSGIDLFAPVITKDGEEE